MCVRRERKKKEKVRNGKREKEKELSAPVSAGGQSGEMLHPPR